MVLGLGLFWGRKFESSGSVWIGSAARSLRTRPRRRPRPRFLASGVLEYWSIGVLRLFRIAPPDAGLEMLSGRVLRQVTRG